MYRMYKMYLNVQNGLNVQKPKESSEKKKHFIFIEEE